MRYIEQQAGCGPPAPVPILQWSAEFEVLLGLYRRLRPSHTLEVGTYHGGTLYHWLQTNTWEGKIVSVDNYAVGVDNRDLYDDWNVHGAKLVVLNGDSHDPRTIGWVNANGPELGEFYDFVVIDAGHFLPEVTRDWNNYLPMVRSGGMICLHDILTHPAWPSIEVGQLWSQIKRDHLTFEIVADRDAEWGGWGCVMIP